MPWKTYINKQQPKREVEARPYLKGEDLTGVTVATGTELREEGMILRNAKEPNIRWYMHPGLFRTTYREKDSA